MPSAALSSGGEEYLSWLAVEKGRARLTLVAYRRDLGAYEQALAAKGLDPLAATPDDVAAYLGALRDAGRSAASQARALSVLRGLHRFLLDEQRAASDPTLDLGAARVAQRLPKALSEAQVVRLLDDVRGDSPLARRDRALLEFLYGTGARVSEAVGLDLAGLAELGNGERLVRVYGKGSKERLVPLGTMAARAVEEWLAPEGRAKLAPRQWRRRGDAEAVFLNARGGRLTRQGAFGIIAKHAEHAGLTVQVSPHVLRHSCASHMLAHGADIRVVQELLGHVSIATTQLYTKVSPEYLRRSYPSAHPRAGGGPTRVRPGGAPHAD